MMSVEPVSVMLCTLNLSQRNPVLWVPLPVLIACLRNMVILMTLTLVTIKYLYLRTYGFALCFN